MFDFVSPSSYSTVFLFAASLLLLVRLSYVNFESQRPLRVYRGNGTLIAVTVLVILYMGFRSQTDSEMGDTRTYVRYFDLIGSNFVEDSRDYGFYTLMLFVKNLGLDATFFLILTAAIYVGSAARTSYLAFYPCGLLMFLAFLTSLSFWTYGINGIRNGVAIALFMWGFAEYFFARRWLAFVLIFVSFTFHKSVLLLVALFFLTLWLRNRVKWFFVFWFICFCLSLVVGHFFEDLFASTGLMSQDYFDRDASDRSFSVTGYRYDFVLYSVVPILVGYYFFYRRQFQSDAFYNAALQLYLGANGFWVLINQNWLSNRFAFLSWCLYPILIVYPFGKFCSTKVKAKVSLALLFQAMFSIVMWSLGKYH